MSNEKLSKSLEIELELFKTFVSLATGLIAGTVALYAIKDGEKPKYIYLLILVGFVLAGFFIYLTIMSFTRIKNIERRINEK